MNYEKVKKCVITALCIVIVQNIYSFLFGEENALIGSLMALVSATFLSRDFTNNLYYKSFTFIVLNISLGIISYIGSLNVFVSLILNLITIFTVTYIYINDFKSPTSYLFLMCYLFLWSSPVGIELLPRRLLSIIIGIFMITFVQFLLNKKVIFKKSKSLFIDIAIKIDYELESMINEKYSKKESVYINDNIRKLIVNLNDRSYKKYYFSNETKLIFYILIALERINIIVLEMGKKIDSIDKEFVKDLKINIRYIVRILEDEELYEEFNNILNSFVDKYENEKNPNKKYIDYNTNKENNYKEINNDYITESIIAISNIKDYIEQLNKSSNNNLNRLNKENPIPIEFKRITRFKQNLNLDSILFKYSLKLSISLSIAMFIVDYFNILYGKWIIITIYVLLQPYSEDTRSKAKNRLKGTGIGVLLFLIIFSFVKDAIPKNIILFIAFYFYFYYEEYYKKVIAITMITLTSMSLVENLDILSFNRLIYVIIGILLVTIFDKYIFHYSIFDSIRDLKRKYLRLMKIIKKEISSSDMNNDTLIKVTMLCSEIEEKLRINNKRVKDKSLEVFILKSNILISDIKHLILYQNTSVKSRIKDKSNLNNIVDLIKEKINNIIVW